MTVSYTAKVATSRICTFLKLLARWRGSIYKLLWPDFLIFAAAYYVLNFVYRFALSPSHKKVFEKISKYCDQYNSLIPVAFVLGFYVAVVVQRWWEQFNLIPWPDRMALFVMANVHGHDDRGRLMRRTIMRYLCLSYVICLSSISSTVKKRFPTFTHMTDAGFMLPNEQEIIEEVKTPYNKYFVPLVWSTSLVTRARKEGRIKDDFAVKTLIDAINEYRGMLGSLFNYDWISVPLVYTQVVTLAVYTFFLSCLMGRQFLDPAEGFEENNIDMYVPVFTFLQFFFYMGWLKVAETLVNPFGEDDDDFDMNWVIDRNLHTSYLIVDEMHNEHPELIKDQYWDETDFSLPYTAASEQYRVSSPPLGSAMDLNILPRDAEFVPLNSIQEDPDNIDIQISGPTDIPKRSKSSMLNRLLSNNSQSPGSSYRASGLKRLMKRSVSRDSRVSRPELLHLKRRDKAKNEKLATSPAMSNMTRGGQFASQSLSTLQPQSPTESQLAQEDIFNMSDFSGDDMSARGDAYSPTTDRHDSLTVLPPGKELVPNVKVKNPTGSSSNLDIGPNISTPDLNAARKS